MLNFSGAYWRESGQEESGRVLQLHTSSCTRRQAYSFPRQEENKRSAAMCNSRCLGP